VSPFEHCELVVQFDPSGPPPATTQLTAPFVLPVTLQVWFAAHPHCGLSPHALLGGTVAHEPESGAPLEVPLEPASGLVGAPVLLGPPLLLVVDASLLESPLLDPFGGTATCSGGGSVGSVVFFGSTVVISTVSVVVPFAHAATASGPRRRSEAILWEDFIGARCF
jgi:hypothetical protein